MITESPNLQLPLQCALAGWRQLMAGWRPAASISSVRLIIFLEAGRSLARAVPHGHAQGYADVRGTATGQTIHRANVFGCMLETRCVCSNGGTAAVGCSIHVRYYLSMYFIHCTHRSDKRRLHHYILPPPLYYSLSHA
jgi:hypothetical protein